MDDYEGLKHTKWECKDHVMFIPKCRRRKLYGQLRQHLGVVFRQLAFRKESRIIERHLVANHVPMLISIPPKYAVAQVMGYLWGTSAIHIARTAGGRRRNFTGEHFWARGYFVPTVGRDDKAIQGYIRGQEKEYGRLDQMKMFD